MKCQPTPRLEIELDKIAYNAQELTALFGSRGICVTAVTKGVCGSLEIASVLLRSGIRSLGDSRIANIRRMREAGLDAQFVLIRSPAPSEAEQVVELADVSLNTEISVIQLLAKHAARHGKIHRVILMIELGDLREGILPLDAELVVKEIIGLAGVELMGIGTNLACFGGIKPTEANMRKLSSIADSIQREYGIDFEIVSGGNSANYQWCVSTPEVGLINHLRIGEAILLGCDPLSRKRIPGLYSDAFTLVAEVIELKTKPSRPYGKVAQDAFGRVPAFEDRGWMRRALLALGEQDVDVSAIKSRIEADILGASSDHLILDATKDPSLEVGAEVRFDVNYGALFRVMTSPYVEKVYLYDETQSDLPDRLLHPLSILSSPGSTLCDLAPPIAISDSMSSEFCPAGADSESKRN
jgi:predicted amino acid racemase